MNIFLINDQRFAKNGWRKIHEPHYYELAQLISGALTMTRSTLGFVLHDVARLMRKRFEQRARAAGLDQPVGCAAPEVKHG